MTNLNTKKYTADELIQCVTETPDGDIILDLDGTRLTIHIDNVHGIDLEIDGDDYTEETYKAIFAQAIEMELFEEDDAIVYGDSTIMTAFETNAAEHGTTTCDGQEYALTQDAYIDGTLEEPIYRATVIDRDGHEYDATWSILDDYSPEDQDESDACDWEHADEII